MAYAGLSHYLNSLPTQSASQLFPGKDGRISARFFNARLSSVFQPIRSGEDLGLLAYEAFVRTFSVNDQGLSIWKLLEHASSDDESVELDRLCRLLHAINFFRQAPADNLDLYLSVHNRLLTAVAGNHGAAFQRVLAKLDIPQQRIVLQLPAIVPSQRWAITHVAENYRRNGFRLALHAQNIEQAFDLLERVQPDVLKLTFEQSLGDKNAWLFEDLLRQAAQQSCLIILRKVDQLPLLEKMREFADHRLVFAMQGNAIDIARSHLINPVATPSQRRQQMDSNTPPRQACC